MVDKITCALGGNIQGKTIAILGLAFKANTDDMRDSPALVIISELIKKGAGLRVYDPEAMNQAKNTLIHPSIAWCKDTYATFEESDAVVIVTEWEEFRSLDWLKAKSMLKNPIVVDLRNLLDASVIRAHGFKYSSLGRS